MWRKLPDFQAEKKSVESCYVSGCHGFFRFRFMRLRLLYLSWDSFQHASAALKCREVGVYLMQLQFWSCLYECFSIVWGGGYGPWRIGWNIFVFSLCSTLLTGHLMQHPGVPQNWKMGLFETSLKKLSWSHLGRPLIPHSHETHSYKVGHTIGDKNITYLIFTPDDLFWVIPCVLCVRKRKSRPSRGTNTEILDKNYLT